MKITYSQLNRAGACAEQCELFHERFGDSVEVTPEICIQHALDFDWGWAGSNFLGGKPRKDFFEMRHMARKHYVENRRSILSRGPMPRGFTENDPEFVICMKIQAEAFGRAFITYRAGMAIDARVSLR